MTLLKQTTASKADDSLTGLENSDVETDCCMFSLNSASLLEKDIRMLNINDPRTESCESGIASFSETYSTVSIKTDETFSTLQDSSSSGDNQLLESCSLQCSVPSNREHVAELGLKPEKDEKLLKESIKNRERVCWEDMCENFPDKDGDTVLHLAVLQAVTQLAGVVRLLGLQSQINCRNRLHQTPLHLAVLTANNKALRSLLGFGASLCSQDCHGNTPLHTACHRNDLHTLKTLLEADPDSVRIGDDGDVHHDDLADRSEEFRQRRAREVKVALYTRNYEGLTCLHLAVLHCNHDLVSLLMQHGADVNATDAKSGRTPLHFAVDSPDPSSHIISTLLLHPNLHINATNFAQQTALQLARGRHHLDLVDLLHMHGAEWSDSIHGYYSSDSYSEEDMEEGPCLPFDDIHVAGQLIPQSSCS